MLRPPTEYEADLLLKFRNEFLASKEKQKMHGVRWGATDEDLMAAASSYALNRMYAAAEAADWPKDQERPERPRPSVSGCKISQLPKSCFG